MKNIDAEILKEKIDAGEDLVLIDVRNPQELVRGRIPGSINIPLDNFENEIKEKVVDTNSQVFIYCLSGSRSIIAAQIMDRIGYKNVYNLNSGMLEWRLNHFPEVNAYKSF